MARKRRLACCCLTPIIILVLIIVGIYGTYAFLPIGTTFGLADNEIISGYTMRDLGIHDKSIRDFLKKPIGQLGKLGEVELAEGLVLNDLGLKNTTLSDIGTKEIKNLPFYDKPLSEMFGSLLDNTDNAEFPEMTEALGNVSLKTLKLGSERLLDLRLKNLIAIGKGAASGDAENLLTQLVPILGKPIGQLGGGEFKNIDLVELLNLDPTMFLDDEIPDEFSDLIDEIDLTGVFCIKALKFKPEAELPDVLNMTLIDLVGAMNYLDTDQMIGDLSDQLLDQVFVPEEQLLNDFLNELGVSSEEERTEKLDEALVTINEEIKNKNPEIGGKPLVDPDTGDIKYSEVFISDEDVVFDTRSQISFTNMQLTAIFNSIIYETDDYQELKSLGAEILSVIIRDTDGIKTISITLKLPVNNLGDFTQQIGTLPLPLPNTLFITITRVINADDTGVLAMDPTAAQNTEKIDNMLIGGSIVINTAMPEGTEGMQDGDTFGSYVGRLVGELFCKFINKMGDTGVDNNGSFEFGNIGIKSGEIFVITRAATPVPTP